jgi:hypothetical protein
MATPERKTKEAQPVRAIVRDRALDQTVNTDANVTMENPARKKKIIPTRAFRVNEKARTTPQKCLPA